MGNPNVDNWGRTRIPEEMGDGLDQMNNLLLNRVVEHARGRGVGEREFRTNNLTSGGHCGFRKTSIISHI